MIARRDKDDNDYSKLKGLAIEMLQELCGNRWSDFNSHDPGVNILEVCCYALLELNYTLEFPLETYLTETDGIKYFKYGLFPAHEITVPSIVTAADYERLIKEKVRQVKHCRLSLSDKHTYFIEIEAEEGADVAKLEKNVAELYHAHRNLCETLGEISFGKLDIPADDGDNDTYEHPKFERRHKDAPANPVLADSYYSLQNHFPDCYGINTKGIPATASPARKTQILQLKAWLLIFDYMIANVHKQTGMIPSLLELSNKIPTSVPPLFSFPEMEKLVDIERLHANCLPDEDYWNRQKSYVLDCLDRIYGEDTGKWFENIPDLPARNEKRACLIRHLPQLNANRFRSFDIMSDEKLSFPGIGRWTTEVFGHAPCLIEHILLSGNSDDDYDCLTLVDHENLPVDNERERYESFVRERLPAHLQIRFVRMNEAKIHPFYIAYGNWLEALMHGNKQLLDVYSDAIRKMLK
jgi:hypothetical protein